MKRFFSMLLIVCMIYSILPGNIYAAENLTSGTCGDDLTWTLSDDGVLTISGTGAMTDYDSDKPWYGKPWYGRVVSLKIGDGVTSIGDAAFMSCENLTSVEIGDSVTTIGDCAFYNCNSLTSVAIPDSVTTIGDSAFAWCTSLTSVEIGDGVTSIGDDAFEYCNSLTSVAIPDSVTTIGDCTFLGCTSLTNVAIPDSITTIGVYAFSDCTSLKNVDIPTSVTFIGKWAFLSCRSLASVNIPASVTSIGDGAFSGCDSLVEILVDDANSNYSNDTSGILFDKDRTILISAPGAIGEHYSIPASVTSIGDSAFMNCKNLMSVNIPDGVTTIGYRAFYNCSSLTSVSIPASVTSIENFAFGLCNSLTQITFCGSAPTFGVLVFGYAYQVPGTFIATAYYPAGDVTWTEEVMQDYGADTITWLPYSVENPFTDVAETDWFKDAVLYVKDHGIMSGDSGSFNPYGNMTRAMMVTTLYRLAGSPEVTDYTATDLFSDVESGSWYETPVNWAYNKGVSTGYPDIMQFGVNDNVTREQLAVFLYRYAGMQNLDVNASVDITGYKGYSEISDYATEAMSWAVGTGLISGIESVENGETVYDLAPKGSATRAQLATILMRFCNYYELK